MVRVRARFLTALMPAPSYLYSYPTHGDTEGGGT